MRSATDHSATDFRRSFNMESVFQQIPDSGKNLLSVGRKTNRLHPICLLLQTVQRLDFCQTITDKRIRLPMTIPLVIISAKMVVNYDSAMLSKFSYLANLSLAKTTLSSQNQNPAGIQPHQRTTVTDNQTEWNVLAHQNLFPGQQSKLGFFGKLM